jgi:hypothetical protein
LFRSEFEYSLSVAKGITDGVLEKRHVTLEIKEEKLKRIVSELERLQVAYRVEEEL